MYLRDLPRVHPAKRFRAFQLPVPILLCSKHIMVEHKENNVFHILII